MEELGWTQLEVPIFHMIILPNSQMEMKPLNEQGDNVIDYIVTEINSLVKVTEGSLGSACQEHS